jgi:hypothetical protein
MSLANIPSDSKTCPCGKNGRIKGYPTRVNIRNPAKPGVRGVHHPENSDPLPIGLRQISTGPSPKCNPGLPVHKRFRNINMEAEENLENNE